MEELCPAPECDVIKAKDTINEVDSQVCQRYIKNFVGEALGWVSQNFLL
jgi:hypothetical protein